MRVCMLIRDHTQASGRSQFLKNGLLPLFQYDSRKFFSLANTAKLSRDREA